MAAAFTYGRVCEKHRELDGKRYARSYKCPGCQVDHDRERKRANYVRKFRGENLDDLHRLWWPQSLPISQVGFSLPQDSGNCAV